MEIYWQHQKKHKKLREEADARYLLNAEQMQLKYAKAKLLLKAILSVFVFQGSTVLQLTHIELFALW